MNTRQERFERLRRVVHIQSPEEAEQTDLVVCSLGPISADRFGLAKHEGPCAVCQRTIHWQSDAKRPPRVCSECALAVVEKRVPMPPPLVP